MNPSNVLKQQKNDRTAGLFITIVIATLIALILFNTFIVHGAKNTQSNSTTPVSSSELSFIEIPLESTISTSGLAGSGAFHNPHSTSSFKAGKGGDVAGEIGNPFGGNNAHGRSVIGKDDELFTQKKVISEKRELIQKPNTNSIRTDENCTLTYTVNVNPDGIIIGSPVFNAALSTSGNMEIIQLVKQLLKAETRWNKSTNTAIYQTAISVKLTAN